MLLAARELRDLDLKAVEGCLMEHPDVIDASVWWSDGVLCAHVTVFERHDCRISGLQEACLERLGANHTPTRVTLMAARNLAA